MTKYVKTSSFICFSLLCYALLPIVSAAQIGSKTEALSSEAVDDISSPETDAVVVLQTGCSGTLIAANIVLTAGHCLGQPGSFVAVGHEPHPRGWMEFERLLQIEFGVDRNAPKFRAFATHWRWPGPDDIVLLKLDQKIPVDFAVPSRVLTCFPKEVGQGNRRNREEWSRRVSKFLRDKELLMTGWGVDENGALPDKRRKLSASFEQFPHQRRVLQINLLKAKGAEGGNPLAGDSGSPLYWINEHTGIRHVIGELQQTGGSYVSTFGVGGIDEEGTDKPNIRAWIEGVLYTEVINNRTIGEASTLIGLFSWFSPDRGDNFASTDPAWRISLRGKQPDLSMEHIHNSDQEIKSGYRGYRFEGYVFDPRQPQPEGTVPLFSWWNSKRGDNYATTKPSWGMKPDAASWRSSKITNGPSKSGYKLFRIEGYIFDPKQPQPPNTIPIYSWWNPSTQDNFLTTDPRWSMKPSEVRWQGENITNGRRKRGYTMYRLEGYVYTPIGRW